MELTDETYDFVVVDPPPPIESSGVSVISIARVLRGGEGPPRRPTGVMVQWVPYGQTLDEFLAHVRSFLARVPQRAASSPGAGGYGFYMIGSDGSGGPRPAALEAVLARPGVLEDVNGAPDVEQPHRRRVGARILEADTWAMPATSCGRSWATGR